LRITCQGLEPAAHAVDAAAVAVLQADLDLVAQQLLLVLAGADRRLQMAGRLVDAGLLDSPIQTAAQEVLAPALQVAQKQLLGNGLKGVVRHWIMRGMSEREQDVGFGFRVRSRSRAMEMKSTTPTT